MKKKIAAVGLLLAISGYVWAAEEPVTGLVSDRGHVAIAGEDNARVIQVFRPVEGDLLQFHASRMNRQAMEVLSDLHVGEEVKIAWHPDGDVRWIDKIEVLLPPKDVEEIKKELAEVEKLAMAQQTKLDKMKVSERDELDAQWRAMKETDKKLGELRSKAAKARGRQRIDLARKIREMEQERYEQRQRNQEREVALKAARMEEELKVKVLRERYGVLLGYQARVRREKAEEDRKPQQDPRLATKAVDGEAWVVRCSTRNDGDNVIHVVWLKLRSRAEAIAEVAPDAGKVYNVAADLKAGDRVNVKGTATGAKLTVTSLEKIKDVK